MNKETAKNLMGMLGEEKDRNKKRAEETYESSKKILLNALQREVSDDVLFLAAFTFCEAYKVADELGAIDKKMMSGLLEKIALKLGEDEFEDLKTGLFSADEIFGDEDEDKNEDDCDCELCKILSDPNFRGEPWEPGDDELEVGIEFGTTKHSDGYAFHAKIVKIEGDTACVDAEPREGCEDLTDREFREKVRGVLREFHPKFKHIKVKIVR